MKSLYDLSAARALKSFPWEQTYVGLAQSRKTVTTFYGDVHSRDYKHTIHKWKDRDSWRWYNSLRHGVQIEGFNVNVTAFIGEHWWARLHEPDTWMPTDNAKFFEPMLEWTKTCGIFQSTGRLVFFVQLGGQGSPTHTDFDPLLVPETLRQPSEFLWLTPPDNPKDLVVGGVKASNACWFNHFVPHSSVAADRPQWSLRIDGVFADDFRSKLI